jgi:hypothetical protein
MSLDLIAGGELSVALSCPRAVVPRLCGQCGAVGEQPLIGAWLQPHHGYKYT